MRAHGGVAAPFSSAHMGGDPLAAEEAFDRTGGGAQLELLFDQAVRHAVVVAVELDVIVDADQHLLPGGEFVTAAG